MKRTFSESWFKMFQPGSEVMRSLMGEEPYMDGKHVIVLQSEVQCDNYVMVEVISKEDYEKYIHKDLKYIENLEKMLEEAKNTYQKLLDENEGLRNELDWTDTNYHQLRCALCDAGVVVKWSQDEGFRIEFINKEGETHE